MAERRRANRIALTNPVSNYENVLDLSEIPDVQLQALKSAIQVEERERMAEAQNRQKGPFTPEPDFDDGNPTPS